jgi:Ca-activated chloride channel homolog
MMMHVVGITWHITTYVWATLLIPVFGFVLIYRHICIAKMVHALAGTRASILFLHTSRMRRVIKAGIFFLGVLFLGLTLLQPHWDKDAHVADQYGRDVFIALDISRSMLAQDVEPSRLERAKVVIKHLVSQLSCERLGLVLFAGSAFIQCPLTEDHGAFNLFLDHVDVETISSGSTSLDAAFDQIIKVYERMPTKKSKLVVLVTDGEDFSPHVAALHDRIKETGLAVFAIGVGTEQGAPIPLYDEHGVQTGHQKDAQGNVVISRHNEQLLRDLVTQSGGEYVGAVHDTVGMQSIVDRIMAIEKELLESSRTWMELKTQYPYFVAVSFVCFVLEWLL